MKAMGKYSLLEIIVNSFFIVIFLISLSSFYLIDQALVSISLVVGILLVFSLKQNIKINLMLLFLSILIVTYFVEITLNFIPKNSNFDNRTPYEVYKNIISKGVDAVPAVYPALFLEKFDESGFMPAGGVSNKTTIFCNESGEYLIYKSDRHGFNNPDKVWNEDPNIILIGDSFTHGSCVLQDNDIASHMRKINGNKNVRNLGMGASGPLLELMILKEFALSKKPSKIFWLFFEGNDISELAIEKKSKRLIKYLYSDENMGLSKKQSYVDEMLLKYIDDSIVKNDLNSFMKRRKFLRLYNIRNLLNKFFFQNFNFDYTIDSMFFSVLNEANRYAKTNKSEIIFVYLPSFERYSTPSIDRDYYKKGIINKVKELGINVIDIDNLVFNKSDDPLSFFPLRANVHYTSNAYSKIASKILESIQ